MTKFLSAAVAIFLVSSFFLAPSALAVSTEDALRSTYDWETTGQANSSRVLGIATPSATIGNYNDYTRFNRYLFGGNTTPDSPFYFVKGFQEGVQLALTFDAKTRDEMRLALAGERLSEMDTLVGQGKVAGLSVAADGYKKEMEQVAGDLKSLKAAGQDVANLVRKVETETAKHNVVLEKTEVRAPATAKDAVNRAIEGNWKGIDVAADLSNRPAMPPDVVSRLSALKTQGLLTDAEVTKLVGVKTREEARTELDKYVNQGAVPPSDFLRLNETVKTYYPAEFFQDHEVRRFQEMSRLEKEKPDPETLGKIQTFAKGYKPGDPVPADLRKYWAPVIQLDELQNTLRPDLVDPAIFKFNPGDQKKFTEVVERMKPRPEDLAYTTAYLAKNPGSASSLPPEYQRMIGLGQKYGAVCGGGSKWYTPANGYGYCVPDNFDPSTVKVEQNSGKLNSCSGRIVAAKGPGGTCSAFPADCLPAGWSQVSTCANNPTGTSSTGPATQISCSSNSHFVSAPFDPSGGYCVANYTPTGGFNETACPANYHRNYPAGPCLTDANLLATTGTVPYTLPRLTATPGPYPSPFYSQGGGQCGNGNHWVPEPINPAGGYCAPDNY